MSKSVVLLTKSKKYHNYCIAGIDKDTGEWVRLVSEDKSIHNAVPSSDLIYEDGTEAEVLDIVKVEIKSHDPNYYQPENYTYDSGYYWKKVGVSSVNLVLKMLDQVEDNYIFHNSAKKLPKAFVQQINEKRRYSLKLIIPENARLNVKRWKPTEPLSYTICFYYNDLEYSFWKITDESFTALYKQEGWYDLDNVALVASLADLYDEDNSHYKLIASIINC